MHCEPHFICATLFLLSQLFSHNPRLFSLVALPEPNNPTDQPAVTTAHSDGDVPRVQTEGSEGNAGGEGNEGAVKVVEGTEYDPHKREPKYACGSEAAVWELCLLVRHYHPSVVCFLAFLALPLNLTLSITYAFHLNTAAVGRVAYPRPSY